MLIRSFSPILKNGKLYKDYISEYKFFIKYLIDPGLFVDINAYILCASKKPV
jgi:hypothetical protein